MAVDMFPRAVRRSLMWVTPTDQSHLKNDGERKARKGRKESRSDL